MIEQKTEGTIRQQANNLHSAHSEGAVSTPTVSVIMPAYNAREFIAAALDSVFRQTYSDYEVIVVNDGSPDTEQLEQALAPYLNRIIYLKQENRGPSAARNLAMKIARGHYFALLDSDDIWKPEYLSVQMAIMESDPSVDVLYTDALLFDNPHYNGKTFMQVCPSDGEVTVRQLIEEKCNVMVSVLARREALFAVGLFDESLRRSEDFDLWLRVLKGGYRIAYHRQPLVHYRRRVGSLSSDELSMCKSVLQVFDKMEQSGELSAEELQTLQRRRLEHQAKLQLCEGKKALSEGDYATAASKFAAANGFFKSRKIGFSLLLLRFAPSMLLRAYNFRNRLVNVNGRV
jgi:glycosyltransferase involved in cell wall biosynthesis